MMAFAIFRFVSANLIAVRLSTELAEVDAGYSSLARVLTEQFAGIARGSRHAPGRAV